MLLHEILQHIKGIMNKRRVTGLLCANFLTLTNRAEFDSELLDHPTPRNSMWQLDTINWHAWVLSGSQVPHPLGDRGARRRET